MQETLEVFIQKIANELEVQDIAAITPDKEFRQLEEWGSMKALIIIAFLNVEYGKNFTGQELQSCKTFRQVYEVLQKS